MHVIQELHRNKDGSHKFISRLVDKNSGGESVVEFDLNTKKDLQNMLFAFEYTQRKGLGKIVRYENKEGLICSIEIDKTKRK